MCEHEHHHEENSHILIRLAIAIVFFLAGFWYKPLFLIAYVLSGFDILAEAFKNIFNGKIFDENFLMGLATIGAICIGEYPEAVMVMVLYQIGEYLQQKAVKKSRRSITELMDIRPDYANLNGEKVAPEKVKVGDIITVYTGEKIPLDGVVISGTAAIDTSALTGEAVPLNVKSGDKVTGGCINLDGVLQIQVTHGFEQSTVSKILQLVEFASSKKTVTENFITKFAGYYTPFVVVLAIFIAIIPPLFFNQPLVSWINRALTFLVISCPCALVISIPLSFFAGIGSASKAGILIKGSNYIEGLSKTGSVIFDKTGTLTKGVFKVTEIAGDSPNLLLKYAAFAESGSSHPIALAIKKAYGKEIPIQNDIREHAGYGVEAVVDGKKILVGNAKFLNVTPADKDGTVVYVSVDNTFMGYIVISDIIKEDAADTISLLKNLGIYTEMLSGDNAKNVTKVQEILGIDKAFSELLPEDKVVKTEERKANSDGTVIFVGDGINDAPVLTVADVGIAMGGLGSDAAIEAADTVIMDDKPSKIVTAITLSRKTMHIVKENIIFVLAVKLLFLILGGYGLVTMWGAVFADVGVSLIAIVNSLRIIRNPIHN